MKTYSDTRQIQKSSLSRLLPLIMCLLPLIIVNIGFRFISGIENLSNAQDQQETARQELETLSHSAVFSNRLEVESAKIISLLEACANASTQESASSKCNDFNKENLVPLLENFQFYVFSSDGKQKHNLLYSHSRGNESRRALGLMFDYLVDQHKGTEFTSEQKRKNDKLAEFYLGRDTSTETIAQSLIGRATYILKNGRPHWFIWNYTDFSEGKNFGFFITVEVSERLESNAKKLAVNESLQKGKGLPGFVSLLTHNRQLVACKQLTHSRLFKTWVSNNLPDIDKHIRFYLVNGAPEPSNVGDYTIFSRLPGNSHFLTVFLMKNNNNETLPIWLWLLNIFSLALLGLAAIRLLLLGKDINLSLTTRFLTIYFLATSLPLGMLGITAVGYNMQITRTEKNNLANRLEAMIRNLEEVQTSISDQYQSRIREIFADKKLSEMIAREGIKSEAAHRYVSEHFASQTSPLPVLGFFLADMSGEAVLTVPKENMQLMNLFFRTYRTPIIENMRNNFARLFPESELPKLIIQEEERLNSLAYEAISGHKMAHEMEKKRSFIITQKSADSYASLMFEHLSINGVQNTVLFIAWDPHFLFEKIMAEEISKLQTSQPEYGFMAFKMNLHVISPLSATIPEQRHLLRHSRQIAEIAAKRSSASREHHPDLTQVAMPLGPSSSLIVTGAGSHDRIIRADRLRLIVFGLIALLSLAITFLSAFFTAGNLLRPITELKSALEKTIQGDLSFNLASERADELGKLTEAFSGMLRGLREREKLAAMISDHAVEAVAASEDKKAEARPELVEFSGIALVSDIRDFTTLCSQHDSETIISLLNEHFAGMTEIITANGGRIYKFIGDAIEAVFTDDGSEKATDAAFKASIEMLAAIDRINQNRIARGLFEYRAGIGLSMGRFAGGTMGCPDVRLDFSIMSDAFDKAAECEAASKKCGNFPVVFCKNFADRLSARIKLTSFKDYPDYYTPQADDSFAKVLFEQARNNKQNTSAYMPGQSEIKEQHITPSAATGKKTLSAILCIFALLCVFSTYSIMRYRNALLSNESSQEETQRLTQLARQIKKVQAEELAFELLMQKELQRIQQQLQYKHSHEEQGYLKQQMDTLQQNLARYGFKPVRVLLTTFVPTEQSSRLADYAPQLSYVKNLSHDHAQKLNSLNLAQYGRIYGKQREGILESFGNFCPEILGLNVTPDYLAYEKFGAPIRVKNGEQPETFYWAHLEAFAPWFKNLKATDPYALQSINKREYRRVAAIFMITVEAGVIRHSPSLLVDAFSANDTHIALISQDKKTSYYSKHFPVSLLKPEQSSQKKFAFIKDLLAINNESYEIFLVSTIRHAGIISDEILGIGLVLSCSLIGFLLISPFVSRRMSNYISTQLYLSIFITALIPVISMSITSDFFLNANFSANKLKNRNTIRSYLNELEMRPDLTRPNIARRLHIQSTGEKLKSLLKNSHSTENKLLKEDLDNYFTGSFSKIGRNSDGFDHIRPREVFIVGKNRFNYHYSVSGKTTPLSETLSEVCHHILSRLNIGQENAKATVHEAKGEMLFQTMTGSIRSNFGADAFQKLANAIGELLELEVTTGSAGLIMLPLPDFDKPEFLLMWLVNLRTQGFLVDLARNSINQVQAFSYDFPSYGLVNARLHPAPGLELQKAAILMNATNHAFSYTAEVNGEKISVEGRPGIHQINNFLVGALPQTAIREENQNLQLIFFIILFSATAIFLLISHQTASDILVPIDQLISGTQAVAQQNYLFRIRTLRTDELGELCHVFNNFAKGLLEKEKMGRMVSERARKAVSETNVVSFQHRQKCALLFIDSRTESHTDKNRTDFYSDLKTQIAELCRIISAAGGDIDKILGSKILGVFPDTASDCSACKKALNAAHIIISEVDKNRLPLNVYAGMHYGEVISGMVGFGSKFDFTVIGDAVNVTARIQKAAEASGGSQVLFSESFVEASGESDRFRLHSEASLKGKSEIWKLYRL